MATTLTQALKDCTKDLDDLSKSLGVKAEDLVPREAEETLRGLAQQIYARAMQLVPRKTGLLASTGIVSDIMRDVVIDGVAYQAVIEVSFGGPELEQAKGIDYAPIVEAGYDLKVITGKPLMHWQWEPGSPAPKYGWVGLDGWAHTPVVERWADAKPFLKQAAEELASMLEATSDAILKQVVIHFSKKK